MTNLILKNSKYVSYYTCLKPIFECIEEFKKMKWLITDHQLNQNIPGIECSNDFIIIDGQELYQKLSVIEFEPQFNWAVLSAFVSGENIDLIHLPIADGNSRYWEGSPTPEIENAICEIVCWDSSATLFIGMTDEIAGKLKILYPDIQDLDLLNRSAESEQPF